MSNHPTDTDRGADGDRAGGERGGSAFLKKAAMKYGVGMVETKLGMDLDGDGKIGSKPSHGGQQHQQQGNYGGQPGGQHGGHHGGGLGGMLGGMMGGHHGGQQQQGGCGQQGGNYGGQPCGQYGGGNGYPQQGGAPQGYPQGPQGYPQGPQGGYPQQGGAPQGYPPSQY